MSLERRYRIAFVVVLALLAGAIWRSQLFTVSRPGERPRPLVLLTGGAPVAPEFDVILPAVPAGAERVRPGDGPLLVHYWAPWERNGSRQIAALDSMARLLEPGGVRLVVVCFDPFPSVARFVARNRIRIRVLLDGERRLRGGLPCPSVPFTYALDRSGAIRIAQAGEVDWLSTGTLEALGALLRGAVDSTGTFPWPS